MTNLTTASPDFAIDAYHQLWRIERSFRMSKHDLQARPVYHHIRESIEAHVIPEIEGHCRIRISQSVAVIRLLGRVFPVNSN
jgi:hypothetical protein